MGGREGLNDAEWVWTKKSTPVGVPKNSRAIFSKVRLKVHQLSQQNDFPIVP
jgi:hypothetical protein